MYKLMFYLTIEIKILRHCHSWLARQYVVGTQKNHLNYEEYVLKLMGKKTFSTILRYFFCLSLIMYECIAGEERI